MSRLSHSVAWILGALLPALIHWSAVIYLFEIYSRGYGRDTWFVLQLYLFVLSAVAGVIGFTVAAFLRGRPGTYAAALLAGVVFAVCQLLLVHVLRRSFPDRDMLSQELVGALLVGAVSVLVAGRRAAG
jgi:hypothetical protein